MARSREATTHPTPTSTSWSLLGKIIPTRGQARCALGACTGAGGGRGPTEPRTGQRPTITSADDRRGEGRSRSRPSVGGYARSASRCRTLCSTLACRQASTRSRFGQRASGRRAMTRDKPKTVRDAGQSKAHTAEIDRLDAKLERLSAQRKALRKAIDQFGESFDAKIWTEAFLTRPTLTTSTAFSR